MWSEGLLTLWSHNRATLRGFDVDTNRPSAEVDAGEVELPHGSLVDAELELPGNLVQITEAWQRGTAAPLLPEAAAAAVVAAVAASAACGRSGSAGPGGGVPAVRARLATAFRPPRPADAPAAPPADAYGAAAWPSHHDAAPDDGDDRASGGRKRRLPPTAADGGRSMWELLAAGDGDGGAAAGGGGDERVGIDFAHGNGGRGGVRRRLDEHAVPAAPGTGWGDGGRHRGQAVDGGGGVSGGGGGPWGGGAAVAQSQREEAPSWGARSRGGMALSSTGNEASGGGGGGGAGAWGRSDGSHGVIRVQPGAGPRAGGGRAAAAPGELPWNFAGTADGSPGREGEASGAWGAPRAGGGGGGDYGGERARADDDADDADAYHDGEDAGAGSHGHGDGVDDQGDADAPIESGRATQRTRHGPQPPSVASAAGPDGGVRRRPPAAAEPTWGCHGEAGEPVAQANDELQLAAPRRGGGHVWGREARGPREAALAPPYPAAVVAGGTDDAEDMSWLDA